MITSPYHDRPVSDWSAITLELIEAYPLSQDELLDIVTLSWKRLWNSQIGGEISIEEVDLPATVVGYFFQKLCSHELSVRYPDEWKGEEKKSDKDLVNMSNPSFSTEMKSSGQMGYSLFGNRSYNQQSSASVASGKDKSGYYITLNFSGKAITLLRLGWIDQSDWVPQGSETGQAAILKPDVYKYKLIEINGPYRNSSPVELLKGIGPKALELYHESGVFTFLDLKSYTGCEKKIIKAKQQNIALLESF